MLTGEAELAEARADLLVKEEQLMRYFADFPEEYEIDTAQDPAGLYITVNKRVETIGD